MKRLVFFLFIVSSFPACSGKHEVLYLFEGARRTSLGAFRDSTGRTVIADVACVGYGPGPWGSFCTTCSEGPHWFNAGGARVQKPPTVTGGKWGLARKISSKNEFVLIAEPTFDWVGSFQENRAAVLVNGKWGFADPEGEFIIRPRFEDRGENPSGWRRLDPETKTDMDERASLEWLYRFEQGRSWVCENGRYGIIDTNGAFVVEPQWDLVPHHHNDSLAWFKQNNRYGVLDRAGQIVFPPFVDSVGPFQRFRTNRIWIKYAGKWALLDQEGRMIIKPTYDEVRPYPTHSWVNLGYKYWLGGSVIMGREGRWGLIDSADHLIIDPAVDSVKLGWADLPVRQNGRWGYIVHGKFSAAPRSLDDVLGGLGALNTPDPAEAIEPNRNSRIMKTSRAIL